MGPKRVLVNLRKAREAKRLKRIANIDVASSQMNELHNNSVLQPIFSVDLTIGIEPVDEEVIIEPELDIWAEIHKLTEYVRMVYQCRLSSANTRLR